ncbi:MAG: (Fe-S)-binding protein [Desulfitobacteriia bacterium]|jgi:glycolate oxidase iron-sulfur subunit
MSIYTSLASVSDEIVRCTKCGNCQAVCPIFKEMLKEVAVARGKLSLVEVLLDGKMELTEGMAERFSLCTTCMACVDNCPSSVPADKIILAARAEAVRKRGLHPIKKVIFKTLKLQRLFDFGMKTGSKFQGLALKRIEGKHYGARMRFNVGLGKEKVFPNLAAKPFRSQYPTVIKVANPKMRVGFFTGCMINYFYTDMGKAVVDVLTANDIEVVIPPEQGCCGIPASVNGDVLNAKALAKRNLQAFEQMGADAVVVSCSSGGTAWKHVYSELLEDEPEFKGLADKWAAKTYDINEFLVKVAPFKKDGLGRVERKVTYHDPCHLNRGQKINQEPREILKSIPGLELVEMKEPGRCCGMAGSFSIVHPDLSDKIGAKKIADIAGTKTDTVATACPACRLQLHSGVVNSGLDHQVVHVVQLLAESYAKGK